MTRRGPPTLPPSPSPGFESAASMLAALALVSVSLSCTVDPARERQIAALGGETPGIPHGPLHRAGQPCGLCHGPDGPDQPEFSLAGTAYRGPSSLAPFQNVIIRFIDSTGAQYETTSNCAGNFFVRRSEWSPNWPVWSKLEYLIEGGASPTVIEMTAAIFRETSCSSCHADPASPSTVGHLYFAEDETPLPEAKCR